MKRLCTIVSAAMLAAMSAAAEQTWTGKISDSMCGATHDSAAEHAGKKMSDRECALACVKGHNAKYVFVSDGKVYNIANQDLAALQLQAGNTVKLTGDVKGDTITASKISMSAAEK